MPYQELSIPHKMTLIADAVNAIHQHNNDISEIPRLCNNSTGRAAQDIIQFHRISFEQVGFGLSVNRVGSIGILLIEPKEAHTFLMQVDGTKSEYQQTLGELANSVERSVNWISSSLKGDSLESWVMSLDDVVTRFEHMGLIDHVKGARKLIDAARCGYLQEQLLVDSTGILKPQLKIQEWHINNRPKPLYDRWMMAIDVLADISTNPTAKPLARELCEVFESSLRKFESDLEAWQVTGPPHPDSSWGQYSGVARLVRGDFEETVESFGINNNY